MFMYTCYKCNAEVSADAKECPNCGANLVEEEKPKKDIPKNKTLNDNIPDLSIKVDGIKNLNIDYVSSDNFYHNLFTPILVIALIVTIVLSIASGSVGLFVWGIVISIAISVFISLSVRNTYDQSLLQFKKKRVDTINSLGKKYKLTLTQLTIDGKGIIIAEKDKKIFVFNGFDKSPLIIDFDQILSYELRENGNKELEGKSLQTFAAGELLGGNAALAVASGPRNINEYCSELIVYIYLKDLEKDNGAINLIVHSRVNKTDVSYSGLYNFAKNLVINLDKVINKRNYTETKKTVQKEEKASSYSDLKELKELLDEGIITKKEFDAKKKEILNIKE